MKDTPKIIPLFTGHKKTGKTKQKRKPLSMDEIHSLIHQNISLLYEMIEEHKKLLNNLRSDIK